MSKRTRQQAIMELLTKSRIPSQAALAEELNNLGFDVTQATLSRDIAEMNLVKSKDGYATPQDTGGSGPSIPDPQGTLRRSVTKIVTATNLVVVKTSMGSASPVALALDAFNWDEIIGTVGGDDTVLVVTASNDAAAMLEEKLLKVLE